MCSGTLIAPHAFLTAEMCIDPLYYNPGWQGYVTFDNPIKVGYPEDTGIAWIPSSWMTLNSSGCMAWMTQAAVWTSGH